MAEVFVSYKGEDAHIARLLVRILRAAGLSVWWDGDLQLGGNWKSSVLKEIHGARILLGLWTDRAVSPDGSFVPGIGGISYVESEHDRAGIDKVVGLLFSDGAVPFGYENRQFSDLTEWNLEDADNPEIVRLVSHLIDICTPEHCRRRIQALELQLEASITTAARLKQLSEETPSDKNQAHIRPGANHAIATLRRPPQAT